MDTTDTDSMINKQANTINTITHFTTHSYTYTNIITAISNVQIIQLRRYND
jgi:hypothetical protein